MTTQSASTRRGQQGRRAQHRAHRAVARRFLGWRPTVRFAVLLSVLLATLISGAAPAAAHPTLLTTEPGTDAAVPDSPAAVVVVFNEAVTAGPDALSVLTGAGRAVPVGSAATARDGFAVITRPAAALPPGSYTVRWRVTGTDGDPVEGEFRFAVGPAISGSGSAGGVSPVVWASAVLRWMLFAGLAIAVGGVVGERFTSSARAVNPSLPAVRSQALPGLLLAATGVLGLAAVLVADTGTVGALWQGRGGQLLLTEAAGLLLALALAIGRHRWAAIAAVGVVVLAEGVRSHANVAAPWWGGALTGVHLAAAAVWVGALLHTARAVVTWRRHRPAIEWVATGYARLAGWVFLLVIGTGTLTAVLLMPPSAVLTTAYGQVLLLKLVLVAGVAALAVTGRLTLRRRDRWHRFGVLMGAESAVLVGVLAVTAVLVSAPPPTGAQLTAPPARGQIVPFGALAGQVGVSFAGSAGQLVVRLSTPRRGDYYAPREPVDFSVTGQVSTPGGDPAAVEFSGCGEGCFAAPVDWVDGDNVLTLRAAASTWTGGTISLLVPWPAGPGADDLARAAAAMNAAGPVTFYETVTSDTSTPEVPAPARLDVTGPWFLAQEPYAAGTAPIAARISRPGEPTRLALGYPAASTNVTLTLDGAGRITEETLTDDTHLIHRRFLYPADP